MAKKPFIATAIELVDHRTIVPADYNPRHMDRRTLAVLVRSLTRFGWVLPVVANRRTGNIVGGHQRARANDQIVRGGGARARHYAKVPVIYVDLSPPEEKALNVLSSMAAPREREHVLAILAALCRHGAQCVVAVRSQHDVSYQQLLGNVRARKGGYLGIPDAGEPGLVVTGAGTVRQKFQKFFGEDEFVRLLGRHFQDVTVHALEPKDPALVALCRRPKAWLDPRREAGAFERLAKALRFEFDLPVNGERLGLAAEAERVFTRWLRARRRGADCA